MQPLRYLDSPVYVDWTSFSLEMVRLTVKTRFTLLKCPGSLCGSGSPGYYTNRATPICQLTKSSNDLATFLSWKADGGNMNKMVWQ